MKHAKDIDSMETYVLSPLTYLPVSTTPRVSILPSHPDYERLNHLSSLLAIATNPHCTYTRDGKLDLTASDIAITIRCIKDDMQQIMQNCIQNESIAIFLQSIEEQLCTDDR